MIQIELEWRPVGSIGWESRSLSPEEYFDYDERPFQLDSVPRFDHAIEYLGVDRREVLGTRITVADSQTQYRRVIAESFWNGGTNRVIERVDETDAPYWEMIVESRMSDEPSTIEVLRIGRDERGNPVPLSHVFLTEQSDGSHSERMVFPGR